MSTDRASPSSVSPPRRMSGFFIRPIQLVGQPPVTKAQVDRLLKVGGREALLALFRRAHIDCDDREWPVQLTRVWLGTPALPAQILAPTLVGGTIDCVYAYGTERYDLTITTSRHRDLDPAALAAALQQALEPAPGGLTASAGPPLHLEALRTGLEVAAGLQAAYHQAQTFRWECEQQLADAQQAEDALRAQLQAQAGPFAAATLLKLSGNL